MRTEIKRMRATDALKEYPPETKIAVVMEPPINGRFYNADKNIFEDGKTLEDAWATTLAFHGIPNWGSHVIAVIFTETPPDPNAPPPPKPKVPIAKCLRPTIIELLKSAPLNAIARAHAMNDLKKALPDECQTFEQITEWVEANCQPMIPQPAVGRSVAGRVPNRGTAFEIEVTESETEKGRCSYSCNRSGTGDVPLRVGDVLEAVEASIENEEGVEETLDRLDRLINESCSDYTNMESDGYEHEDYESSDYENHEVSYSRRRLLGSLTDWLQDNHPEKLEQLQRNE